MIRYKHTQVGYVIIVAMTAGMVMVGISLAGSGFDWSPTVALTILAVALVLFYSLTVVIREEDLEIRLGAGIIRKKFKLADIESCRVVKNAWYYGWGIRLTPHGWLYRVSGFQAVEIKLNTGRRYRIGTDAPGQLEEALRQATIGRRPAP